VERVGRKEIRRGLLGIIEDKDLLKDTGKDMRIILEWILKLLDERAGRTFRHLRKLKIGWHL
jgi:hypothetical protein